MMSEHLQPFLPPASLASSSFEMPVSRAFFAPSVFLRSFDCLLCANERMASSTPQLSTSLKNLSEKVHLEPNADGLSVMYSFV